MDLTLIIPPVLTAILTYIIAVKRTRLKQAQVLAEIQSNAIKVVAEIEERLRKELKAELKVELDELKKENASLHSQVVDLQGKLSASDHLIGALKDEISALRSTIDLYKDEMARNKKRLSDLENGNGNGNGADH